MTEIDKLKNILAFLSLVFGEDLNLSNELMNKSPSYLIEKWQRYCESERIEHEWGLHPSLRARVFERYLKHWNLDPTAFAECQHESDGIQHNFDTGDSFNFTMNRCKKCQEFYK